MVSSKLQWFSVVKLFVVLRCLWGGYISFSLSGRWRLQWDYWPWGTKEMPTETATPSYRTRNWWSFLFLWCWWESRDTIQWVHCYSVSHLSPNGTFHLYSSCIPNKLNNSFFILNFLCRWHGLKSFRDMFQTSKMGSPQLEATFDTIVEAFLFLDNNGDGKLNKRDMVKALNEASPCEKSSAHITRTRFSTTHLQWFCSFYFLFIFYFLVNCFNLLLVIPVNAEEMDGNRSGKAGFRDFLFALTDWVGLDGDEEIPISGS